MKVVRLRNFISFCLTADYQAYLDSPCSYTLSSTDRDHYRDLCDAILAMRKISGHNLENDRVLAPYIRRHLHEPSASLGISSKCAELIVLRFALALDQSRRYEGCTQMVRERVGMPALAKKLWTDRQLLIPHLGMPESTRLKLSEGILWMARVWFVSIDGSDCTLPVLNGLNTTSQEEARFKYTLSQRGQAFVDDLKRHRTLGQRMFTMAVCGIVSILRVEPRPRSRLPIFPENAPEVVHDQTPAEAGRTQPRTSREYAWWEARDSTAIHHRRRAVRRAQDD